MKGVTSNAEQHIDLLLHGYSGLVSFEPCAGALLEQAGREYINRTRIEEIIQCDPAMAARMFSLAASHGIDFEQDIPNISKAVIELPESVLRKAIFDLRPFRDIEGTDEQFSFSAWNRYMITIALASAQLAAFALPEDQRPMAYWAGLLYEMGNLALADLMPKSFVQMMHQSQILDKALEEVQDEHINTNGHIVARRLGQQWQFGEPMVMTLWLASMAHPGIKAQNECERPARVVRAAAQLARTQFEQFALGRMLSSHAFARLCESLDLDTEQIEHVRTILPQRLEEVWSQCVGQADRFHYEQNMRAAGSVLAKENLKLCSDRQIIEEKARLFEFTTDILSEAKTAETVLEAAEKLAICWRGHFRTGRTAVISIQGNPADIAIAVGLPAAGETVSKLLSLSPDQAQALRTQDTAPAKLCPPLGELLTEIWPAADPDGFAFLAFEWDEKNVAGLFFEPGYPVGYHFSPETITALAKVVPNVLTVTQRCQNRMRLAENFSSLVEKLERSSETAAAVQTFAAMAEFSAGAAHELNNPLAVISGRAQLLNETEQDPERKRILEQIQQRSHEISGLIGELMTFAKPETPDPVEMNVEQLIDRAWQQIQNENTAQAVNLVKQHLDNAGPVFADASQLRLAIYHLLINAAESLNGQGGQIEVTAEKISGRIVISISDHGEGMDPRTLEKAFDPFFSSKTAGRKRGLGLAIARRLIELNGGKVRLESHLGSGTRAMITLKMPPGC